MVQRRERLVRLLATASCNKSFWVEIGRKNGAQSSLVPHREHQSKANLESPDSNVLCVLQLTSMHHYHYHYLHHHHHIKSKNLLGWDEPVASTDRIWNMKLSRYITGRSSSPRQTRWSVKYDKIRWTITLSRWFCSFPFLVGDCQYFIHYNRHWQCISSKVHNCNWLKLS